MIENLVRENIKKLNSYVCARDLYSEGILLDANENPFSLADTDLQLNRYPDPHQLEIRKALSRIIKVDYENLFFGVGSDEIIDLLIRIFCEPKLNEVIIVEPTYGMYKVACDINNVKTTSVLLNDKFQLDVKKIEESVTPDTKIIFICSPNNPTGALINKEDIYELCKKLNILVVVDEAYIDFSEKGSVVSKIKKYDNLIILRTFSKAWGLAGVRIGFCIANKDVIKYLMNVKAPYNISTVTKNYLLEALKRKKYKDEYVKYLIAERESVSSKLKAMKNVTEVYSSDSNFILFRCENASEVQKRLAAQGIIIRDRSSQVNLENCLRVTIGTQEENKKFIMYLDAILNKKPIPKTKVKNGRSAFIERKSKETIIKCFVDLDGSGKCDVVTGIGFYDHLLNQIARHANINLNLKVLGDIHVDEHHIVEDSALVLGETIINALGDKKGIKRYGFLVPMNDSTSYCTIDISGRAFLNYKCKFQREMIGDLPTELFEEFFVALSTGMKSTISIKVKGRNEHHKIEVMFKAFAKALNEAIRIDERSKGELPSTKGLL